MGKVCQVCYKSLREDLEANASWLGVNMMGKQCISNKTNSVPNRVTNYPHSLKTKYTLDFGLNIGGLCSGMTGL